MTWTKRQYIESAFDELGMASYVFDLSPEQLNSAMVKLDTMMATWNGIGLRLGYPIASSPSTGSLDTDCGVPDSANEAIVTNLALKLAPSYGKTVSNDTKVSAKQAYNVLLARNVSVPEMQLGAIPAGAGFKRTYLPWLPSPTDPLTVGNDSELEL